MFHESLLRRKHTLINQPLQVSVRSGPRNHFLARCYTPVCYRISIGALLLGVQEQCAVLREQFGILVGCSVIGVRIEDELCIGERRDMGQKIGR